jgi:hypothetical protein
MVKREWARYESMLGAIADSTSPESLVAKRAAKRLAEIAADLKLSNTGVLELANQARLPTTPARAHPLLGLLQQGRACHPAPTCFASAARSIC